MQFLKRYSGLMENTTAYRLWQAPFQTAKLGPVLKHNDFSKIRRVLDVGCGPGTNSPYFQATDYTGFDINSSYIEYARRKYRGHFVVQDVCTYTAPTDESFDFIILNSLLHHLSDDDTHRILEQVEKLTPRDGHVHIVDLVIPATRSIPRWLALNDRGDFPRPLEAWRSIFTQHFESVVFEPFPVKAFGVELWHLIYFKGKSKA